MVVRDLSLSLALFAWMDTSLSIGREIGSRLVRVVERAREAALFFFFFFFFYIDWNLKGKTYATIFRYCLQLLVQLWQLPHRSGSLLLRSML